ncbi:MAG: DNA polymerase III subunit gamma/tau [Anaerolineae bacterium]|nr:DNA polymerase III subunit gamma/tau [Anaerolineae bacterium]
MPEQALYLKWRPAHFEDVIGQQHVTRTLQGALRQDRVRHAYLFSGPRGTGKTTTARLLAKAVNCEHADPARHPCNECPHCIAVNEGRYLDLIEIDAASHTGVDDVRELRDKIAFSPGEGQYKVYIIDEVHRFSGPAFDALLKTLEEPPEHAIFVLATTELEKVPDTILSRCLPFEFRRVSVAEVAERLRLIADAEGFNIDQDAIALIARQGTGSVRDSISLLDQVVADPSEHITLAMAENALGAAGRRAISSLVDRLLDQDVAGGLAVLHAAVDGGADPRQFARQVVEHLRNVLLVQTAGDGLIDDTEDAHQTYARQASRIGRGALLRAIRAFNEAHADRSSDWQPQLPLELALLDSLAVPEETVVIRQQVSTAPPQAGTAQQPVPDEPEPEASAPGEPPAIGVLTVRQRWTDVGARADQYYRNLTALLNYAQLREVSGNTIVLNVQNAVFKEKLEAPERRKALVQALRDVFNLPLTIRVDVVSDADARTNKDTRDLIASDALMAEAMHLGGEVSDIRPGPIEEESDD